MKYFFCFLFSVLSSLSAHAGMIVTDSIHSKVLNAVVKYNVYLPDFFMQSGRTYPVVYLLHGLTDTYTAWVEKGRMQEVADQLISSGEAEAMVIVMPNAGGPDIKNTWNGYFDMPGWAYETFFFTEFIPAVESKYRIVGDKRHRAVMGLSMGGGGSTVYCQRHPDMFSSCYAMSAWLSTDRVGEQTDPNDRFYYTNKAVRDHSAVAFLESMDKATADSLRTVRWFFDCGDDDGLMYLSVKMHELMQRHGIKNELRIRDGVHNWEYWHTALRTALPFASRSFER